ncbi:hypothetical protein [Allocoleopsis sp.]|uniref:hypothetical protein n=1 Tax=Allocoleopsis sp. TaxID=3088169 RepID=UPI002FD1556E
MDINLERFFQGFFSQLLPLLFGFLDDALLLILSRLGIHFKGLEWLSPVILSCTILYWAVKLWQNRNSEEKVFQKV